LLAVEIGKWSRISCVVKALLLGTTINPEDDGNLSGTLHF
jgi:hypothetical protein